MFVKLSHAYLPNGGLRRAYTLTADAFGDEGSGTVAVVLGDKEMAGEGGAIASMVGLDMRQGKRK